MSRKLTFDRLVPGGQSTSDGSRGDLVQSAQRLVFPLAPDVPDRALGQSRETHSMQAPRQQEKPTPYQPAVQCATPHSALIEPSP